MRKKLLSVILAAALIAGILPINAIATAESTAVLTNFDTVDEIEGLSANIASDKNIAKNLPYSTEVGTEGAYNYRTATANLNNRVDPLLNGEIESGHKDIDGFRHLDDDGNYIDNDIFITFNFAAKADISAFALIGSTATPKWARIEEYKIYAADDISKLYEESSLLFHFTNSATENDRRASQYYAFGENLSAKHFGIRIIKALNKNSATPFRPHSYLRACELVILGELDLTEENKKPTSIYNANQCIKDLATDYNLMQDGYDFTDYAGEDGINFSAENSEIKSEGFNVTSYNTINDILDANVSTHADVSAAKDSTRLLYLDADGSFKDGICYTMTVKLHQKAKIDKIFMAFVTNSIYWQASEYKIYLANSFDDLYTGDPVYTVTTSEVKSEPYGTVVFETPKTAQFIGIKITKGVKNGTEIVKAYGADSSYLRISEFAVFGKYDMPYFDYTVKASENGIFDEISKNVYSGKQVEVTAPLTKNGYTFSGFTVNGNPAKYTKDTQSSELSVTIDKNTEIIANYIPNPTFVTSDVFAVKETEKTIKVDLGTCVRDLKTSLNAAGENISVTADAELSDGKFLTTGNTMELFATDTQTNTYDILLNGDINADGDLTVTDILKGIDTVLGNTVTESEKFAFDMNNDTKLSASDVVYARTSLLNKPTVADYDNKSFAVSEMPKKVVGRSKTGTDGSITLDWAASTLMFNADCCGDITVSVANKKSLSYYRVFVDGVEKEISFFTGGKKQEVTLAENLPKGLHTVEFYKESQGNDPITFYEVTVNGEICDAPKNKDLLIEFLGDSITCGESILGAKGFNPRKESDATLSYGFLTAKALNADWSIVSRGGATCVESNPATITTRTSIPEVYNRATHPYTSTEITNGVYTDGEENIWKFERTADIVVINLGTNDSGNISATDPTEKANYFKNKMRAFVEDIISKNGTDTKIVFAFGMMTDQNNIFVNSYNQLVTEFGNKGISAYYCALPKDLSGGKNHPSVAGHKNAAETLTKFIKENVLD